MGRDFFLARLYLGDTHDMYFGYFGFDVFIFLIGCICYGETHFVASAFTFLVSHMVH